MRDRHPHYNRNHSISLGKSVGWFLYNRNIVINGLSHFLLILFFILTFRVIMLKNGQTYFKNLVVWLEVLHTKRKIPSSNPNRCLAGLWEQTSLWGSQGLLGWNNYEKRRDWHRVGEAALVTSTHSWPWCSRAANIW